VIDCPPSLGLLSLNALAASDLVLIPIEMSTFGLAGVERMYETIALLRKREERDIAIRVLPTLVDSRTRLCRHFLREVWQRFAEDVSPGAVLFTVRLREAVHKGVPIVAYDPTSAAAAQYDALAKELMSVLRGEPKPTNTTGQMTAIGRALEEARRRNVNDKRRQRRAARGRFQQLGAGSQRARHPARGRHGGKSLVAATGRVSVPPRRRRPVAGRYRQPGTRVESRRRVQLDPARGGAGRSGSRLRKSSSGVRVRI